jgi:hypothetical protein
MCRLILLLSPISLLACYSASAQGSAQPSAPAAANTADYQGGRTTASGWVTRPLDPQNCGTPDQPRACPPMPSRPLKYFPANRHRVTG